MVNITTVYNSELKTMQYVYINEELLVIASYDYIRNELPTELEPDDFVILEISQENFTTEPSYDYITKYDMDDDVATLLLDCMEAYIKNYVKDTGHHYFTSADKLPEVLYKQLTDDYRHWLEENNQLVETDGYKIIVDERYIKAIECETPNEIAAKELQQHLPCLLPPDVPTDHVLYEKFVNEKIQIIFGGKMFTFDNGADIYNALDELAKFVISEQ